MALLFAVIRASRAWILHGSSMTAERSPVCRNELDTARPGGATDYSWPHLTIPDYS